MREYEVAVGFLWNEWESFHVDARSEEEAHRLVVEKNGFNDGSISFITTLRVTQLDRIGETIPRVE